MRCMTNPWESISPINIQELQRLSYPYLGQISPWICWDGLMQLAEMKTGLSWSPIEEEEKYFRIRQYLEMHIYITDTTLL